jgi:predicted ABC-type ATPase
MPNPQMIIVGGPNGAGKTTFALKTIHEKGFLYIGADKIAAEIAPDNPCFCGTYRGTTIYRKCGFRHKCED